MAPDTHTNFDLPRFLDIDLLPKMVPFPFPHSRQGYCQFVVQNRFLAEEDPHEIVDEKTDLLYEKGGFLWRGRVMQGLWRGSRWRRTNMWVGLAGGLHGPTFVGWKFLLLRGGNFYCSER